MTRASLLVVIALGCGDNQVPVTARPQSGSRLALEYMRYEDGTRQLASTTGVHDLARDEPCTIVQWSDGRRYCTPAAHRAVFLDAACTREAGRIRIGEPGDYAIHEFVLGSEALPSRLYQLGAPIEDDIPATFQVRDGACTARTDYADGDRYVELGAEIDRSELVHTTRRELPADDCLDALVDTSADGLQLPAGFFDVEQVLPCELAHLDAEHSECRPSDVTFSFAFTDAACEVPAIVVPTTTQPPDLTLREAENNCVAYHPVGSLVTAETAFTRSGQVCTPRPLSVGERLFSLGPTIELGQVARHRLDGSRRLALIEDGETGFPDRFVFDTEAGRECSPMVLANSLRCVPPFDGGYVRYTDPLCLDEVLVAEVVERCAPPVEVIQHPVARTFHVIGEVSPAIYEITTADRCAPAIPPLGGVFHVVGEAIPLAAFPVAMREIE